jgi:hypothetical protein
MRHFRLIRGCCLDGLKNADGRIMLWDLNIDHAIQRICATTHNTLTRQQWNQYVSPQLRYNPPCRS